MSLRLQKTIATYNKIARSYADKIQHMAPQEERDTFLKYIPLGGRILDVGCAAGRDTAYFASKGYQTVGIDLSRELLNIAKAKHPDVSFQLMDMHHLKFAPSSFDGIWACAVLLHLERSEVLSTLKGFYRVLKPDGILYIQVKKGTREKIVKEDLSQGEERTFTYFLPDEMKRLVIEAGFTVIDMQEFNDQDRGYSTRNLIWLAIFAKKL